MSKTKEAFAKIESFIDEVDKASNEFKNNKAVILFTKITSK